MKNKKGFTLIELLVVVLIIGILAAIAVPQYQKAVAKSKSTQLVTAVKSLYDAQKAYYLQNGKYATTLKELDINYPRANANYSAFYITDDIICQFQTGLVFCNLPSPDITLGRFLESGRKICYSYSTDNYKGDNLCQTLSGTSSWANWCTSADPCHGYTY